MTKNESELRFMLRVIRGGFWAAAVVGVITVVDCVIHWPHLGFEEGLVVVMGVVVCGLIACRYETQRMLAEELGERDEARPRD